MKLKHVLFLSLLFVAGYKGYGQKIIVDGKESDGKLQWSDFTGKVDKSSPFAAYTGYTFKTKIKSIKPSGDTSILIEGFEVILELDQKKSWARKDKITDELLVHEQGHFNLGILTMNEILTRFKQASFNKSNYQTLLQTIVSDASKKYNELGIKYDKETDHSKNTVEQTKWNDFFSRQFSKVD